MLIKKLLIIIALVFFMQTFCLGQGNAELMWKKNTISMSPLSPAVGNTVIFASVFAVKNESAKYVTFIAAVDGKVILKKNHLSVVKNVPQRVAAHWKAMSGNHEIKFSLHLPKSYKGKRFENNVLKRRFKVTHRSQTQGKPIPVPANLHTPPKKPDLIVDNLHYIYLQQYPNGGGIIKIWIRIRNIGNAESETGKFKLIIEGLESAYFPEVENYYNVSMSNMFPLLPGKKYSYGPQARLIPGKYRVTVICDINDSSKEFKEANNRRSMEITIVKR